MYKQISVNGEDFVGLLGFASDSYSLVAKIFRDVRVLEVPVVRLSIYGTNLVGLFCAGNSKGVLFPYFVDRDVVDFVRRSLGEYGVDVQVGLVDDVCTAVGNLVSCNDRGAVVSPLFRDTKVFRDVLDVEVVQGDVGGHSEVGSCCLATNKGFIVHPDVGEEGVKFLSEVFGVEGRVGTVNYGFPYVKAGLIANSRGYITGLRTTGIELGRIDEALGFI